MRYTLPLVSLEIPARAVGDDGNRQDCCFGELFVRDFCLYMAYECRTETDGQKEDSVIFVLISRTNFSRTSSGFYVQQSGISVQRDIYNGTDLANLTPVCVR